MNIHLTKILYELGVHIGESTNKVYPINSFFILGKRNYLHIIDIQITIFFLKKACFFVRSLGLKNSNLFFYYTNIISLDKRIVSFFIYHLYKNNHSFVFNSWRHGLFSNFYTQALDVLIDLFPEKRESNYYFKFTSLLLKMIFFSLQTREVGTTWQIHLKNINKYWRFFSFYCFFKNLNILPETSIIMNSNNLISPIKECSFLKIPVVGITDTNSISNYFTYPIPSNDNSFIIAVFFFILFINCYQKGQLVNFCYFENNG
jgi:small subunit ribosomal protein S2